MTSVVEQVIMEQVRSEFLLDQPDLEITNETDLIAGSILDSLGIFVLISFIEERFGVEILPDEVTLDNFQSIRSIAGLVRAKQALAPSA